MDWQTATSIASIVAVLIAILGGLYKCAKIGAKVDILWEIFRAEAERNTRRKGMVESSSEYRLTQKGQEMMPSCLKDDIKLLMSKKKINPGKAQTFELIKMLGGVPRLALEADKLDIELQELVVMIETYIRKHLD